MVLLVELEYSVSYLCQRPVEGASGASMLPWLTESRRQGVSASHLSQISCFRWWYLVWLCPLFEESL